MSRRIDHAAAARKFMAWRAEREIKRKSQADQLAQRAARVERAWLARLPRELREALDPNSKRKGKWRRR